MLNKKTFFSQKSLVFGNILHNNFSIGYILCNMNYHLVHNLSLSMYAQFQSIIYRTFLCVLSPSFRIVVLRKMTLKFKKWYTCYICIVVYKD